MPACLAVPVCKSEVNLKRARASQEERERERAKSRTAAAEMRERERKKYVQPSSPGRLDFSSLKSSNYISQIYVSTQRQPWREKRDAGRKMHAYYIDEVPLKKKENRSWIEFFGEFEITFDV